MQDALDNLVHLDPRSLHQRAADATKRCAGAAWELAACLVAMEKSEGFRCFDCANVVEYAERHLGLGYWKTLELLRGGRALQQLPQLSKACRDGRLCWSKVRELAKVEALTAETEAAWLAFAICHSTRELERAVAVSPRQYRQQMGWTGGGQPSVSVEPCQGCGEESSGLVTAELPLQSSTEPEQSSAAEPSVSGAAEGGLAARSEPSALSAASVRPPAPAPPRLVKVELFLTADQLAVWDQAVDRVRSQKGRRVSKEIVAETLARHYLAGGDSRTRTNHPVVIRVDAASGATFYETGCGVLPASAAAVEDALACEGTLVARSEIGTAATPKQEEAGQDSTDARQPGAAEETSQDAAAERAHEPDVADGRGTQPRRKSRRKPIPAALRRAALARANYRCERCGATTRLELHHVRAVCDGGTDVDGIAVLCHDCHAHRHAGDFAADPRYIQGRAAAVARRKQRDATSFQPDG